MKSLTLFAAYLFLRGHEFIRVPCTQWAGNKYLLNEKINSHNSSLQASTAIVFCSQSFLSLLRPVSNFSHPLPVFSPFLILPPLSLTLGEGRERGRETLMCESYVERLPLTYPQLGTWPATQARALTGNRTRDLLVCRLVLNPLSHTSQSAPSFFFNWELHSLFFLLSCFPLP